MKFRITRLLPKLRIHSWGGMGSQLFTLHFALRVRNRFPDRKIMIVIHTSGVTRREEEFDFSILGFSSITLDDYVDSDENKARVVNEKLLINPLKITLKKLIRIILIKISCLSLADKEYTIDNLKFWCISVRGHYTNIDLDENCVFEIMRVLKLQEFPSNELKNNVVIHYRLGDLLHLINKHSIQPTRIIKVLESTAKMFPPPLIFTDSEASVYYEFVNSYSSLKSCKVFTLSPLETLQNCVNAEIFVGTNAKLSVWAAIFRSIHRSQISYLPSEMLWTRNYNLHIRFY